jgi:hypothetical protein
MTVSKTGGVKHSCQNSLECGATVIKLVQCSPA